MPKTWQTDLAFVPQELEGVLTLLREREEELQLLRREINGLRTQKERDSSAELHEALRDLALRHRQSLLRLQDAARSDSAEECASVAEVVQLKASLMTSEQSLLELEEELKSDCCVVFGSNCLRWDRTATRNHLDGVVEEVEASTQQCHLRYQDVRGSVFPILPKHTATAQEGRYRLHSLQRLQTEIEVQCASLKQTPLINATSSAEEALQALQHLESEQELKDQEEARLRSELKQKRQEMSKSDCQRGDLLATVARGVSELAAEIAAQKSRSETELHSAKKKLDLLKGNAKAKAMELQAVNDKIHQSRLATDAECKQLMQQTKDCLAKISTERHQREKEMQEDLLELGRRIEATSHPDERALEALKTRAHEQSREEHRSALHRLRLELRQLRSKEALENAKSPNCLASVDSLKDLAKTLASKCEQSWQTLSDEKQKAALAQAMKR
eukprot:g1692.t1